MLSCEGEAAPAVVEEGDRPPDGVLVALITVRALKLGAMDPLCVTG